MSEVRFSRRAREDLLDIWLYIARQTSQTAADRILDRVEDACRAPARHPRARSRAPGDRRRGEIAGRPTLVGAVSLDRSGVQIVRFIDGARDLKRLEWASD